MKIKNIILVVSVIGMCLSYLAFKNDYLTHKNYNATVINKEAVDYKRKGLWGKKYYLIYKLEDGRTFRRETDPKTYRRDVVGEPHTLNIPQMRIKQTGWQNVLYFLGPVLLFSFSLTGIIVGIFYRWFEDK